MPLHSTTCLGKSLEVLKEDVENKKPDTPSWKETKGIEHSQHHSTEGMGRKVKDSRDGKHSSGTERWMCWKARRDTKFSADSEVGSMALRCKQLWWTVPGKYCTKVLFCAAKEILTNFLKDSMHVLKDSIPQNSSEVCWMWLRNGKTNGAMPSPNTFFLLLLVQLPKMNSIWPNCLGNASPSLLLSFLSSNSPFPTQELLQPLCSQSMVSSWQKHSYQSQGLRVAEADFQNNLRPPVTSFVAIQRCLHSCDKTCSLTLPRNEPISTKHQAQHQDREGHHLLWDSFLPRPLLLPAPLMPQACMEGREGRRKEKTYIHPSGRSIGGI